MDSVNAPACEASACEEKYYSDMCALLCAFCETQKVMKLKDKILARTRDILVKNVAVLSAWMDGQEGRFGYRPPDAGAICYVRYGPSINSTEFAETLRTEMDLLVVPGDHFGMDHYLRLGFGLPTTELKEALARMAIAFDAVEDRSRSATAETPHDMG